MPGIAPAQLYVNNGNAVGEYNATTGAVINANFITGLNKPTGIVLSGDNLFVANFGSGTVGEYDARTGAAINANLITGLSGLVGLALSGDGTALFVGYNGNTVGEYNATTGTVINPNFITELSGSAFGFALSGNNLFVGSGDFVQSGIFFPALTGGTVGEYDASTGATIKANFITGLNVFPVLAVGPTPSSPPTPTVKELVWENTVTGEHSIWVLNNGMPTNVISLPTGPVQWHIAAAADSPDTAQADLVWENTVTGEHTIWILNNGIPLSSTKLPTISTEWEIANQ
ncbi:MAG: hypothetical protein JO170_17405 [Verrucomicrobia bacterium]|nr:hypothetical protein [Verrucomicrobiota bacterium]